MINRELVGKVFGRYTVVSQDDNPSEKRWWCRCDCGKLRSVYQSNLLKGAAKSCGCLAAELSSVRLFHDKTGLVYGRLTVLKQAPNNPSGYVMWECLCNCGTKINVIADNLGSGGSQSCGCLQRDRLSERSTTHGLTGTKEHKTWNGMKTRCLNPNSNSWDRYGGRGICIAEPWIGSFETFLADLGPAPSSKHTLERNDTNGDYAPGNCRWATRLEQTQNRRTTRKEMYKGKEYHLIELASIAGVSYRVFHGRLARGWTIDEAISGIKNE